MADEESGQGGAFDESRLSRLIELMKEHGLSEVELCDADQQIRISRSLSDYGPAMFTQVPPSGYAAQPAAAPQAAETPAEPASSTSTRTKARPEPRSRMRRSVVLIVAGLAVLGHIGQRPAYDPLAQRAESIEELSTSSGTLNRIPDYSPIEEGRADGELRSRSESRGRLTPAPKYRL